MTLHEFLWIFLPVILIVTIPRAIRTWSIRAGRKFTANWEIVLFFCLLWIYIIFIHFAHKSGM